MNFHATKHSVTDRGVPPDSFLTALVDWGKLADASIFSPHPDPAPPEHDIYSWIRPVLGPWENFEHRRAVMLEVMRVHAGYESSWNWNEGVDTTNATSMRNITGQETGAWQVSFDSTALDHGAMKEFATNAGIDEPAKFIKAMKHDHALAMDYYSRLIRHSIRWAGPIKRREIDKDLRRDAVAEFMALLASS